MSEPTQEFRAFCVDQVQRLSQFKAFGFMDSAAQKDYRRWLERKCQTKERVEQVMDAAIELEELPTIAVMNQIFGSAFAPQSGPVAMASCVDCGGSGWMVVRVGAYEGAAPCRCGGKPPAPDPTQPWESAA